MERVAGADAEISDRIFTEKMRLFSGRAPIAILTNIINATIVASLCNDCIAYWGNWIWLCVMCIVSVFRLMQVSAFRRAPEAYPARYWAQRLTASAAVMGLTWAFGLLLFGLNLSILSMAIIAFLAAGMTAGSVAIGAAYRPTSIAFSSPIVIALFLVLMMKGSWEGYMLAVCTLVFSGVLLSILNFLSKEFSRSIQRSFDNEILAQDLRAALAREEAARAAQTQLVANVSHELRTPLGAVIGMIDLARASDDKGKRHHFLSIARDSSDSLLVMLNDLLEVSRLDLGHLDIKSEPMSPSVLAQSVGDLFRDKALDAGLVLNTESRWPSEAVINGDNNRVRQILVNLVGNALKFTFEGKIDLIVAPRWHEGRICAVEFQVKDSGIGIAESDQDRIFQRFQQVDGSHTRLQQGTGLGLAISKELAGAMGGSLTLHSVLGEGSVFSFLLPCNVVEQDEPEQQKTDNPLSRLIETIPITNIINLSQPDGLQQDMPSTRGVPSVIERQSETELQGHKYALIVDDNEINCVLISALLGQAGIQYEVANDGFEALHRLNEVGATPFDIVLMDVQMPEIDGLETTRRIRMLDNIYQNIPVVAVTANAFKEQCEACLEAGMQGFVVKPIEAQKLLGEINRVLDMTTADLFTYAG